MVVYNLLDPMIFKLHVRIFIIAGNVYKNNIGFCIYVMEKLLTIYPVFFILISLLTLARTPHKSKILRNLLKM